MKILQIMIAFDQLINTILGGMADETISSRAHRNRYKSWRWRFMRRLIDGLFFFGKKTTVISLILPNLIANNCRQTFKRKFKCQKIRGRDV
ncbi:hypothetical protein [Acinetobacter sp.]|uniref:hypothetical protein n=1 Tax=Acinetobacter sp. TaxID=472 RepID=UPI003D0683D6